MPPAPDQLLTPRLKLRRWQDSDLPVFAAMNCCPKVMKNFPSILTRAESDAMVERMSQEFEDCHYGLWAVEILDSSQFIGFVGLHKPNFEAHFTPCVEVGWRLTLDAWGKGYATEAAKAAIDDFFERLSLGEIVSMTSLHNTDSIRVMERLGMTRNVEEDFDHPKVTPGDRLCRHVLYRLRKDDRRW